MDEATNKNISRAVSKAARWQLIVTVVISVASLLLAGLDAALSAIAGGASVIVGSYAGVVATRGRYSTSPSGVLITLLKAEAIKVLVTATLLLLAFKFYRGMVPLSLIGGLAAAALVSGIGLRAIDDENNK